VRKRTSNKLIRDEKGQALVLVLILILLGGLIITPMLSHMATGLKVGKEVYEEKMYRLYAADSGVEDSLWQIKNDKLSSKLTGYDEYNYGYLYPYPAPLVINNKNVAVTIENVWMPPTSGAGSIPIPSSGDAENIAKYGNTIGESQVAPRLIITGNPSQTNPTTQYQIGIIYYYGTEGTDALKVQSIGIWLPPGFHYVSGSSSLETGGSSKPYYPSSVQISPYKSGEAVVWTFNSPSLSSFLPSTTGSPMAKSFTFSFTGPAGQTPSCVSWIKTTGTGVSSIPYAWDADKRVYGINSVAKDNPDTGKNVTVDAYALKTDPRELGSGTSGDYVAIGNSLMMPDPNNSPSDPNQDWRSRLLKESSATINSYSGTGEVPLGYIPANATVQAAYLYWSGFIDHYYWKKQGGNWSWSANPDRWDVTQDDWTGLVYDANNPNNLTKLIDNSKVNTVSFGTTGAMQDVTATQCQVCLKDNDSPKCWYYTCYYDATALVQQLITAEKLGADGSGTYTLGHASQGATSVINKVRTDDSQSSHTYKFNFDGSSDYTGYPLGTPAHKKPDVSTYDGRYHASYAGWSLVIIYSTPDMKGHQLYLYDIKNPNFKFVESYPLSPYGSNPDFDGDGNPGGKVSGFLVPQQITGETNAARITCFVGEGDKGKTGDSFKVTGPSGNWAYLLDGVTGTVWNDVWNSKSLVASAPGVDIDTLGINPSANPPQYITWSSNILKAGDTWAQIDIPTTGDGFTLSYIILSFRSSVTYGGTVSYLVRG
jgi:hypothetical protein